jgi:hypothetical protein
MDQNSLTFMQEPDKWPNWPVLSVKKPVAMHAPVLGVMLETGEGVKPVVYLTSMFELGNSDKGMDEYETEEFTDFEGVYDAGWRVD